MLSNKQVCVGLTERSTLDDFLKEEGLHRAAKTTAIMRVIAWQLAQEMERQGISKTELAAKMHTSRAQLDRILKAEGNATIETLQRAAALVGRELHVELQPAPGSAGGSVTDRAPVPSPETGFSVPTGKKAS